MENLAIEAQGSVAAPASNTIGDHAESAIFDARNPTAADKFTSDTSAANDPGGDFDSGEAAQGLLGQAEPPAEDSEEIDYEGRTYRVPKALKPALMMQADYTRKTQEVAERRRQVEAAEQAVRSQAQATAEQFQDVARVLALNERIASFERADWNALSNENPQRAQALWMEFQQMKDRRAASLATLQQKADTRARSVQLARAKAIEDASAVLTREIKGWSPDYAGKLAAFAKEGFGFTDAELSQVLDPRLIKLLNRAYAADQFQKKQARETALKHTQSTRPSTRVGGNNAGAQARKTTDASGDELPTEEWAKRERERTRRRA